MTTEAVQIRQTCAPALTWALTVCMGLFVGAISVIELAVVAPDVHLVDELARGHDAAGYGLAYQVVLAMGIVALVASRAFAAWTWWTPVLLAFGVSVFVGLNMIPDLGGFLVIGYYAAIAAMLTIIGLPFAVFIGPGIAGLCFGGMLLLAGAITTLDVRTEQSEPFEKRAEVLATAALAAIVYFVGVAATGVFGLRAPVLPVADARGSFAMLAGTVLVTGSLIAWAAYRASGGKSPAAPIAAWGVAAVLVAGGVAGCLALVDDHVRQQRSALTSDQPVIQAIARRLRLGHPLPQEPIYVGDRRIRTVRDDDARIGTAFVEAQSRRANQVTLSLRATRALANARALTIKRYRTRNPTPAQLACTAPAADRTLACRVVARGAENTTTQDGAPIRQSRVLWHPAQRLVMRDDLSGPYLQVPGGGSVCTLVWQDQPVIGYMIRMSFECAAEADWQALAERMQAFVVARLSPSSVPGAGPRS